MTTAEIIEKYLPNYYSRDDVAFLNDLWAYNGGDWSEGRMQEFFEEHDLNHGEAIGEAERRENELLAECVPFILEEAEELKKALSAKNQREFTEIMETGNNSPIAHLSDN